MADIETSKTISIVHPGPLLREPKLGTPALALVSYDEQLTSSGYIEGFLRIRCADGTEGYIPAALCAPLAVTALRGNQPMTQVRQQVWLHYHIPAGDYNASPWIVRPTEALAVLGQEQRFLQVRRPDGQVGYVPELLGERAGAIVDGLRITRVRQPIAFYSYPKPGGQFSSERIIAPHEQLLVLGEDGGFKLIQREDGTLGYVPAALCGPAATDALLQAGPIDLGWIALGLLWAMINSGALLLGLRTVGLVSGDLRTYVSIGVALALAAAFWFVSPRRYAARSFALGVLLAAAMFHANGGNWIL